MRSATSALPERTLGSQGTLAFRGVLLLVFGVCEGALLLLAFRVPHITASMAVLVLTAFVLADGLATLFESVALTRGGFRVWPAANGVAGVAAGAFVLFSERRPLTVLAWWAIVTGVLEAGAALSSTDATRARVAVAALSIIFGLITLAGPVQDAARLILVAAAYGVIAGGLRVHAARRGMRWTGTS
jgi:uncharacterized membrane protein HdeD (DUF308 family)